jgi:ATP/maltotriose-dependent transcriptional regulator MalT
MADELERGRRACAEHAWTEAHEALDAADRATGLAGADLDLLATAAYMLGAEQEYLSLRERAYAQHVDEGDPAAALRSAFWLGVQLAQRGETARASGWLERARRLLDESAGDRVEQGYLLIPRMFELEARGEFDQAAATAGQAVEIASRHGDPDLLALAGHARGHLLIEAGRVAEGIPLLDEAMVAAAAGELSPIATGLVYCGVVLACRDAFDLPRAREWTATLSSWCDEQPDLVAFTGRCRVHRAEIMQLEGAWSEALEEARRAAQDAVRAGNLEAAGEALYVQGEVHRLRGDAAAANSAYREASALSRTPQPGLALLRLDEGAPDAAAAAVRRALAETAGPGRRTALLAGCVEVMLATGELDEAADACRELEALVETDDQPALGAIVAQAKGAIELAREDPRAALPQLRAAERGWRQLGAPYERARVRSLAGLACRELGDEDGATLEFEAARDAFARLGAAPELRRLDAVAGPGRRSNAHGLTRRELQVLRLVADGRSNKAIAAELVLSERTVDRHVSNIYAKLGVRSRAQATARAYEQDLV